MSKTLVKKHSWLAKIHHFWRCYLDVPMQKSWEIIAMFFLHDLNPNLVALHWGQWGSYVLNWPVSSLKIQGSWETWMEVPQRKEGREGAMFSVERSGGDIRKSNPENHGLVLMSSHEPWSANEQQGGGVKCVPLFIFPCQCGAPRFCRGHEGFSTERTQKVFWGKIVIPHIPSSKQTNIAMVCRQ